MRIFGLLFFISLLINSCIKNNENPSWIEINPWVLNPNSELGNEEGVLSHNFTDAWIYVDGKLVGVFELPVKLPILKEGKCSIKIFPTIRNNGIAASKIPYPFVKSFEQEIDLNKNQTVVINPQTQHLSDVKFFIENFEEASLNFEHGNTSLAFLKAENNPTIAKYGQYGHVHLTSDSSTFYWYNNESNNLILPKKGAEVFLEIDYRSTNSLISGLIEVSSVTVKNHTAIQMNAQDPTGDVKWKKIYIDLKELVTNTPDAEYYKISLSAVLDEGDVSGDIIIDNIKVLHF